MANCVLSPKVSICDSLTLLMCEVALFRVDIFDFIVVSGTMDPNGKGKMVDAQEEPQVSDD